MSESWTPGPWIAYRVGFGAVVRAQGMGRIAECMYRVDLSDAVAVDANARLIAAAPEMAEFLQMLDREPFASSPVTREEARGLLSRIRLEEIAERGRGV